MINPNEYKQEREAFLKLKIEEDLDLIKAELLANGCPDQQSRTILHDTLDELLTLINDFNGSQKDCEWNGEFDRWMEHPSLRKRLVKLGDVGVDSGQLVVCDPSYIDKEWERGITGFDPIHKGRFNYAGCCLATHSKNSSQLNYKLGHPGVGVAFGTGGDGVYEVFAEIEGNTPTAVIIKFSPSRRVF